MRGISGREKGTWRCRGLHTGPALFAVALTLACVLPMANAQQVTTAADSDQKSGAATASFLPTAGQAKHEILKENLPILADFETCAKNLREVYAALRKYEEAKGTVPDWLSDLVPDYLSGEGLFCPDDPSHRTRYWPDPKLPCSYCYELSASRFVPALRGTMRNHKVLQRGLFGDVVPIVRCFHHSRVLNLAWDGRVYTSALNFEHLFIPGYTSDMLFGREAPKAAPVGAKGEVTYQTDLEAFLQEMDRAYPFFDLKGIRKDREATSNRLREEVKECKSDGDFLGIVLQAIRCLRDGHMGFRDMKASLPPRPPRYYPGVSFLPATNERVVMMSDGTDLDPDLKIGTIVTKIDGEDARQYLEDRARTAWAEGGHFSSPQRARLYEFRIPLRGEKGEKHTIAILADGEQREVELTSDIEARGWPHWYNRPGNLKQVGSCSYTRLPSEVGYIYLRRIDRNTGLGMKEAFSTYADAKGWIIDIRGNGGGNYDQALFDALRSLPRPLAILIDAGCFSAGETLARDFVRHGNARLFGSKTAGSSGRKRTWTFPSGIASLSVPVRSHRGISGQPIEFNGIEPDVKVEALPEEVA